MVTAQTDYRTASYIGSDEQEDNGRRQDVAHEDSYLQSLAADVEVEQEKSLGYPVGSPTGDTNK